MIDSITRLTDTLEGSLLQPNENANIDRSERVLSLITGTYIFCKGIANLFSHPVIAFGEAVIGVTLLNRGVTGNCVFKAISEKQNVFEENIIITEMQTSQPLTSARAGTDGDGNRNMDKFD